MCYEEVSNSLTEITMLPQLFFILLITTMTYSTTYFFYKDWKQVDAIVIHNPQNYGDPLRKAMELTQCEYDEYDYVVNE